MVSNRPLLRRGDETARSHRSHRSSSKRPSVADTGAAQAEVAG